MNPWSFSKAAAVLLLFAVAGCASGQEEREPSPASRRIGSPHKQAIETSHSLRQQANILRDMAQRRAVEAELLAREANADPDVIAQKRDLSRKLAAKADELERQAVEAAKAIPHGMVPQ